MATVIRPELSKKNKYWVERNRYYELKYFTLQYSIWKKAYLALSELANNNEIADLFPDRPDPTAQCGVAKKHYSDRIEMIEQACKESDDELYDYILKGVTEGLTYERLKMKYDIPCSRDTYYDRYRKFFFILNKLRE